MGLIVPAKFMALDASGDPLSGGKLHTYIAGTTTNKTTYSDSALTTPNANPVVLDSRGEAKIFGTGSYKFVLKTSADVEIWSVDDVEVVGVTYLQDADADTKIQVEETADEDKIRFDIAGTEQIILQDGALLPTTDNDIDLGSATKEFKDVHIDGVLFVDEFDLDGTYQAAFPTNPTFAADGIIMLGLNTTIIWMYINAAPPGWKAYTAEGTDKILAVSGGSDLYNVDGGVEGGETWANLKAHTHTGPSHNHQWYERAATSAGDSSWQSDGSSAQFIGGAVPKTGGMRGMNTEVDIDYPSADMYTILGGTGASGAQSTADVRPTAAVGKLWQLDTA